jgi:hypothetical protein
MSRNLAGFEQTWRILGFLLFVVVVAEAWYVHVLSGQVNAQRVAASAALDQHLSDAYLIGKLEREAAAAKAAMAVGK